MFEILIYILLPLAIYISVYQIIYKEIYKRASGDLRLRNWIINHHYTRTGLILFTYDLEKGEKKKEEKEQNKEKEKDKLKLIRKKSKKKKPGLFGWILKNLIKYDWVISFFLIYIVAPLILIITFIKSSGLLYDILVLKKRISLLKNEKDLTGENFQHEEELLSLEQKSDAILGDMLKGTTSEINNNYNLASVVSVFSHMISAVSSLLFPFANEESKIIKIFSITISIIMIILLYISCSILHEYGHIKALKKAGIQPKRLLISLNYWILPSFTVEWNNYLTLNYSKDFNIKNEYKGLDSDSMIDINSYVLEAKTELLKEKEEEANKLKKVYQNNDENSYYDYSDYSEEKNEIYTNEKEDDENDENKNYNDEIKKNKIKTENTSINKKSKTLITQNENNTNIETIKNENEIKQIREVVKTVTKAGQQVITSRKHLRVLTYGALYTIFIGISVYLIYIIFYLSMRFLQFGFIWILKKCIAAYTDKSSEWKKLVNDKTSANINEIIITKPYQNLKKGDRILKIANIPVYSQEDMEKVAIYSAKFLEKNINDNLSNINIFTKLNFKKNSHSINDNDFQNYYVYETIDDNVEQADNYSSVKIYGSQLLLGGIKESFMKTNKEIGLSTEIRSLDELFRNYTLFVLLNRNDYSNSKFTDSETIIRKMAVVDSLNKNLELIKSEDAKEILMFYSMVSDKKLYTSHPDADIGVSSMYTNFLESIENGKFADKYNEEIDIVHSLLENNNEKKAKEKYKCLYRKTVLKVKSYIKILSRRLIKKIEIKGNNTLKKKSTTGFAVEVGKIDKKSKRIYNNDRKFHLTLNNITPYIDTMYLNDTLSNSIMCSTFNANDYCILPPQPDLVTDILSSIKNETTNILYSNEKNAWKSTPTFAATDYDKLRVFMPVMVERKNVVHNVILEGTIGEMFGNLYIKQGRPFVGRFYVLSAINKYIATDFMEVGARFGLFPPTSIPESIRTILIIDLPKIIDSLNYFFSVLCYAFVTISIGLSIFALLPEPEQSDGAFVTKQVLVPYFNYIGNTKTAVFIELYHTIIMYLAKALIIEYALLWCFLLL